MKKTQISIKRVRHVEVVDGKRTEKELTGQELEEWIKNNIKKDKKQYKKG